MWPDGHARLPPRSAKLASPFDSSRFLSQAIEHGAAVIGPGPTAFHVSPGGGAQRLSQSFVIDQTLDGVLELPAVPGPNDQPRAPVKYVFAAAGAIAHDDGQPGSHRLQRHQAKRIVD